MQNIDMVRSGAPGGRLNEAIIGADILFSDTLSNPGAASAQRPSGDANLLQGPSAGENGNETAQPIPQQTAPQAGTALGLEPVTKLANDLVDDFHQLLEAVGRATGSVHTVHGLISSAGGEVGLGEIAEPGQDNLLTDVLALPSLVLSGQADRGIARVIDGTASSVASTSAIPDGLATDLGFDRGAVGTIGQLGLHGLPQTLAFVNNVIGDVHDALGSVAAPLGLSGTVGGLIGLGKEIGLSSIGDAASGDLLTHILDLPGAILEGNITGGVQNILGDAGDILAGTGGVVEGVLSDLQGGVLGGGAGGHGLPLVGGLLGGGIPIASGLLGNDGKGLPIFGQLLDGGGDGLPIVGDLLNGNDDGLPIIGNLLGGDGLLGDGLLGGSIPLPVVGGGDGDDLAGLGSLLDCANILEPVVETVTSLLDGGDGLGGLLGILADHQTPGSQNHGVTALI
jgi:hypothetical protein